MAGISVMAVRDRGLSALVPALPVNRVVIQYTATIVWPPSGRPLLMGQA
jgi:hypothetical protein